MLASINNFRGFFTDFLAKICLLYTCDVLLAVGENLCQETTFTREPKACIRSLG